jgi:transposase InsO family protein
VLPPGHYRLRRDRLDSAGKVSLRYQRWRTHLELAVAIADYIEHFYNPARRHSALGYLTPDEYEEIHSPQPQATLS